MKKFTLLISVLVLPALILAVTAAQRDFLDKLYSTNALPQRDIWRLTERVYSFPTGMDWQIGEKMVYHYNATFPTRPDSVKLWVYANGSREWYENMKVAYQYNNIGQVTTAVISDYYDLDYYPYMMLTASYDDQHRLTHMYMYIMDMPGREWYPMSRWHISYVTNTDFTVNYWEEGWDERIPTWYRINFTYDTQGRILEEVEQSSPDSLTFTNSSKTVHVYHPSDTTTGDDFVQMIAWELPLSMTMFFDDGGPAMMTTQDTYYNWFDGWELSDRDTSTYQTGEPYLLLNRLSEYWMDVRDWFNDYQVSYSYDNNDNLLQSTEQWWDDMMSQWEDAARSDYTWEYVNVANGDDTVPGTQLSLTLYPNPFSGEAHFRASGKEIRPVTYQVFNLKGQLVFEASALPGQTVTWNGRDRQNGVAGSGIYLLKASNGTEATTQKMLKIK
jgi:hypothetical protein